MDDGFPVMSGVESDDESITETQRTALRAYGLDLSSEDDLEPQLSITGNPWGVPPVTLSLAAPVMTLESGDVKSTITEHCVICMEAVGANDPQNLTLPCQHTFHASCIRTVRRSRCESLFPLRAQHAPWHAAFFVLQQVLTSHVARSG